MKSTNAILRVMNVSKRYLLKDVLVNISFSVRPYDFIIIIGPSGAGKTTLLGIIAGFEEPDEGKIEFLGRDIHSLSDDELAEYRNKHIGFIFQNFNLIPFLNALENVIVPAVFSGVKRKIAIRKAKKLLTKLGLSDKLYNYPNQLSGGEQQRVAIARALINDPELIPADEPTANLDRDNEQIIMEILSNIARSGKSVILVTHKEYLAKYGTKVFELVNGRLIRR